MDVCHAPSIVVKHKSAFLKQIIFPKSFNSVFRNEHQSLAAQLNIDYFEFSLGICRCADHSCSVTCLL